MSSSGVVTDDDSSASESEEEKEAKTTLPISSESKENSICKLESVNQILSHLQNKEKSSFSSVLLANEHYCNENSILSAVDSKAGGICIVADRDIVQGTMILSCEPEAFVMESPEHRKRYCSYCCRPAEPTKTLAFCKNCSDCQGNPMVAYCSDCASIHESNHDLECQLLRCLRDSISPAKEEEDNQDAAITNRFLREIFDSSVALLAIRIMCRSCPNVTQNINCEKNHTIVKDHSKRWSEFKLIHEHPLTPSYTAISTLLTAAFDAVAPTNGSNSHQLIVTSTMGKILGCSHAIVDPSLPLGRQTLGRAIYVGHSFYNHSCAPNAYLSTTNTVSTAKQKLTARVHLLKDVCKGDEITLSYLPLSGLLRNERQTKLNDGYGFACDCSVCADVHHPLSRNSIEDKTDDQAIMAGIDSIRNIQYELNDWILDLSKECESTFDKDNIKAAREELTSILGTIEMTQRGIQTQGLPDCHEVSIESERLIAAVCDAWLETYPNLSSLSATENETHRAMAERSRASHQAFFRKVSPIRDLFDPVAYGTQQIANERSKVQSRILLRHQKLEKSNEAPFESNILTTCLGHDHPWVQELRKQHSVKPSQMANQSSLYRKDCAAIASPKKGKRKR